MKRTLLAVALLVAGLLLAGAIDAPCRGQCGNWMCNTDSDCGTTCRCEWGPIGVGRCN